MRNSNLKAPILSMLQIVFSYENKIYRSTVIPVEIIYVPISTTKEMKMPEEVEVPIITYSTLKRD